MTPTPTAGGHGRLEGRTALVTGASSGIGLAVAERFAREGARVLITGRRAEELERARATIGRGATAVRGDSADLDDLDRIIGVARTELGGLDVLVASAGRVEPARLQETTPEGFDRTFSLNARGTFFLAQKALPVLRDGSSVVLVGSAAHRLGVPSLPAYSASKAAVASFARTWAADLAERRIRVNTISPGTVDTPALDRLSGSPAAAEAAREQLALASPLGRLVSPQDVAAAALFLAGDEAASITGVDLLVDGGESLTA